MTDVPNIIPPAPGDEPYASAAPAEQVAAPGTVPEPAPAAVAEESSTAAAGAPVAAALVPAPPAPVVASSQALPASKPVKSRNVLAVWIGLPLITLGFYLWYWYPKINAELAEFDPKIKVTPFVSWLAYYPGAILIVPPFVSYWNTGKRIAAAQQTAGIGSSCNPLLGVLLMFVFGLNTLYYQSELNKIAAVRR